MIELAILGLAIIQIGMTDLILNNMHKRQPTLFPITAYTFGIIIILGSMII